MHSERCPVCGAQIIVGGEGESCPGEVQQRLAVPITLPADYPIDHDIARWEGEGGS